MSVKHITVFCCDNCNNTHTSDPTPGCQHEPPKGWLLFLVPTGSMSAMPHHLCPPCKAKLASKVPLPEAETPDTEQPTN